MKSRAADSTVNRGAKRVVELLRRLLVHARHDVTVGERDADR